jgi:hypothetical protein
MSRLIALAALLLAFGAAPAMAQAPANPFSSQTPAQPQSNQLPTPAPEDHSDHGDGTGPGLTIAIAAIVVLLIGGIWWAITRDARVHAPKRSRHHTAVTEPDANARATPGSRGRHQHRSPNAGGRRRRLSKQERERRKRGRAR